VTPFMMTPIVEFCIELFSDILIDLLCRKPASNASTRMDPTTKYLIPVGMKMLDVLELFRTVADELTLEQVTSRTGIAHTTAFRILHTLVHRRYLLQSGRKYRLNPARRKLRIGFATLTRDLPFAEAVRVSLETAASKAGVELIVYDNQRSSVKAVENAKAMIDEKVDLAIEFQRHEDVAPVVADILQSAAIPAIAIHIPQPGATYFGIDNFRAGYTAGEALASYARKHWRGRFDLLLLLDVPQGGIVLQSRMTGVRRAIEDVLGPVPNNKVLRIDGGAVRDQARRAAAAALGSRRGATRVLISATSDDGALGAVDALGESRRRITAAVVGLEGTPEALDMMKRSHSSLQGTVAFFPEQYGPALIDVSLRLLRGEQVAPFQYVRHQLIGKSDLAAGPRTAAVVK
jgi:ribose transport system substrate-binding protein